MNIKNIRVKVTYEVELGGYHALEKEFKQLKEIFQGYGDFNGFNYDDFNDAREWLNRNIKEGDCYDITYQIEDLE